MSYVGALNSSLQNGVKWFTVEGGKHMHWSSEILMNYDT